MRKQMVVYTIFCAMLSACNPDCGANGSCGGEVHQVDATVDSCITAKVKKAILSDRNLATSARFVHVKTSDGIVTLSGAVPTKEDLNLIIKKVKNIDGVQKVNNQMTVLN